MRASSVWPLVPALALAFLPPACSGTESGNPRCAPPCTLDVDGTAGARGALDGARVDPAMFLSGCGRISLQGELRWGSGEAEQTGDGGLRVTFPPLGAGAESWILIDGRRWWVVGGSLTLTTDAQLSAELDLVQDFGPDAGAPSGRTLRLDGEIEVHCAAGEPGVAISTGAGDVMVECRDIATPPCDDTPSGCSPASC